MVAGRVVTRSPELVVGHILVLQAATACCMARSVHFVLLPPSVDGDGEHYDSSHCTVGAWR
jgi:hypothetical protein